MSISLLCDYHVYIDIKLGNFTAKTKKTRSHYKKKKIGLSLYKICLQVGRRKNKKTKIEFVVLVLRPHSRSSNHITGLFLGLE